MAYANLEDVISMTESLFSSLAAHVSHYKERIHSSIPDPSVQFTAPFHRIDFIPDLEAAINRALPDLSTATAASELTKLFEELSLPLPDLPTLPRMLDKLCSTYLEPQCHQPT